MIKAIKLTGLVLLMKSGVSFATTAGEVADTVLEPTSMIANTIYGLCYAIGAMLIIGSLMQYREHRANPTAVKLSTPIFFFISGLAMILLPVVSQYSVGAELL